jgi:hypothetical protein
MCKELEVALHQHEAYVNQYLTDEKHEQNLFDSYLQIITLQLRTVVPETSPSDDMGREIRQCTDNYITELASEISWMRKEGSGCILNLQKKFNVNSMLIQKIIRVCHLVSRNFRYIPTITQRQIHSMLLILKIAIEEHEKYVNQFLSNSIDERLMYEKRREYIMKTLMVGICAHDSHDSVTSARRVINMAEFEDMMVRGIRDPYNSILGLTPTPTHNINYLGTHHHGWRD